MFTYCPIPFFDPQRSLFLLSFSYCFQAEKTSVLRVSVSSPLSSFPPQGLFSYGHSPSSVGAGKGTTGEGKGREETPGEERTCAKAGGITDSRRRKDEVGEF